MPGAYPRRGDVDVGDQRDVVIGIGARARTVPGVAFVEIVRRVGHIGALGCVCAAERRPPGRGQTECVTTMRPFAARRLGRFTAGGNETCRHEHDDEKDGAAGNAHGHHSRPTSIKTQQPSFWPRENFSGIRCLCCAASLWRQPALYN